MRESIEKWCRGVWRLIWSAWNMDSGVMENKNSLPWEITIL